MTVLSTRALNRATLARQYLLERTTAPVPEAVAHLAGLQAQEPQEPFTGLWSRLRDFTPGRLDRALTDRHVVRTHLMRRTVHLVTADDALAWRARHDAMLRGRVLATYRRDLAGIDPDELAALVPMAQLPPRGLWRTTAGVRNLPLDAWLGRDLAPPPDESEAADDPVGQQLVRRYLAAYGPASTADLRSWSGLAGLPAAVRAVRDELVTFRDERGRVLLDLPDAPRPSPDTPAPVRFLPAFDNAILGYRDRGRIVDDADLGLSVAGLRAVLVDGRVAATWTTDDRRLDITPLRPLSPREQEAVGEEAHALAAFLARGIVTIGFTAAPTPTP